MISTAVSVKHVCDIKSMLIVLYIILFIDIVSMHNQSCKLSVLSLIVATSSCFHEINLVATWFMLGVLNTIFHNYPYWVFLS
jgi:hypothetical protein